MLDGSDTFGLEEPPTSGGCVWLTGLSGAGKSTTAFALYDHLVNAGYAAEVIDGDSLRRATIRPLGFSKADRDANVCHAATTACNIANRGAIAVCALISPYRDARATARRIVGAHRFVEVFVDTPLAVCEARDPKGLYRRWRRGEVQKVTGLDDPYEPPFAPELVLFTELCKPADNVKRVIELLIKRRMVVSGAGRAR
jgi:sulfate adenylyltransferase